MPRHRTVFPRRLSATLFIALLPLITACGRDANGRRNEIDLASTYVYLQAFEVDNRETGATTPIFLKSAALEGKLDVLAVPTGETRAPLAWIVVNDDDGAGGVLSVPEVKQLDLSCAYLPGLYKRSEIRDAVKTLLERLCRN